MENIKKNNKDKKLVPDYAGFDPKKLKGYPFERTIERFERYIKLNDELEDKIDKLLILIQENNGILTEELIEKFEEIYPLFEELNNFYLFLESERRSREPSIKKRGRKKLEKLTPQEEKLRQLEEEFRKKHTKLSNKFFSIWEKLPSTHEFLKKF
ncbi:MAG: hypothetical protein NZ866_02425 [Patescibacteria group bacterium]|nr:hypothetical protein [Patescibacteria group bacterium]